ncbi:MAG: hypothetical protein ACTHK0_09560 [Ginsengibacter sp.]
MKARDDKNIESLVEKMMMESSLQAPPFDFTSKVMSDVLSIEKKKSITYNPVISKRSWFIIFAAIGGLICTLIFNGYSQNQTANNIDFHFINVGRILNVFSGFQFSSLTLYIILLGMIMIFIQILFLKSYFNKRF